MGVSEGPDTGTGSTGIEQCGFFDEHPSVQERFSDCKNFCADCLYWFADPADCVEKLTDQMRMYFHCGEYGPIYEDEDGWEHLNPDAPCPWGLCYEPAPGEARCAETIEEWIEAGGTMEGPDGKPKPDGNP